jgi:hypothetical protein
MMHPTMPQPPQPGQQGLNIVIPPEEFGGRWANMANLQRTPHEFTLDFIRVGPQGQFGTVQARINMSPLLLYQLKDLLDEHWQAYTEDAGSPEGHPDA